MPPSGSARNAIRLLALAGFNAGISLRCVEPMLPKLAEEFAVTAIGLILAGYGMGGLFYSSTARALIRALGERGLVAAGGALGAAFYVALALSPHWALAVPCTILLGLAFYLVHNTIQTRATEVAPQARGSAVALYASSWALGQAGGAAAMGLAVAALDTRRPSSPPASASGCWACGSARTCIG